MQGRIAISAYCHALILGFADDRARDVADHVFLELFPEVSAAERKAILDAEIDAVEPRGMPIAH
ncbi:hypothetical protein [Azospirillum sp.]|uniref:hypothetical protein n=1 Tax=Azospirillum sp. TaxID=34012 RepID=UPI003D73EA42